jgi:hypothetical protein
MIIVPPEGPTDGVNLKQPKDGGQNCLMKLRSKVSFLVSCKQMISHFDSMILLLMADNFI